MPGSGPLPLSSSANMSRCGATTLRIAISDRFMSNSCPSCSSVGRCKIASSSVFDRQLVEAERALQQTVRGLAIHAAEVQPEAGRGIQQVPHGGEAGLVLGAIGSNQETIHDAIVFGRSQTGGVTPHGLHLGCTPAPRVLAIQRVEPTEPARLGKRS
jgi:hypothetical protein